MSIPVVVQPYWKSLATAYMDVGPPLRPSSEDISFLKQVLTSLPRGSAFHALLLGVTPEIARLPLPEGSFLTAVDTSEPMAQAVWPGDVPGRRQVVCSDWLALPLHDRCCDVVIADGSLNCVPFPNGLRALAASVRRAMRDDGILAVRCFVRPASPERPEDIFADMLRGTIPSFHHCKFRLLMAMQKSTEQGVQVGETHRLWTNQNFDRTLLAFGPGWDARDIDTIELYRNKSTVHSFPTLAELRSVLADFFDEVSLLIPSYNLGERCPTLVLRPRDSGDSV
jgi:SAM-dependent methyltransferase